MAYLALMLVLVAIGSFAVWFKERRPDRTPDTVADFRRSLQALAPRSEERG